MTHPRPTPPTRAYTCACGTHHRTPHGAVYPWLVWGTTDWVERLRHECVACGRTNWVEGGVVRMSLQAGKRRPRKRPEA